MGSLRTVFPKILQHKSEMKVNNNSFKAMIRWSTKIQWTLNHAVNAQLISASWNKGSGIHKGKRDYILCYSN